MFPPEIIESLDNKIGYMMVVKGPPGSGKTTFALELLKRYVDRGIYFSTRTTTDMLYDQFPWLKDVIDRRRIVEDIPASISSLLEDEIKFEYTNKIEFAKEIYDAVDTVDTPAIIVLDSLEGIEGQIGEEGSSSTEMEILNVMRGLKTNAIIVLERSIQTSIDYLVDGVITIEEDEIDGRRIREIWINKMRGIRRRQFKYLMTLDGGRFRSFEPPVSGYHKEFGRFNPIKSNETFFSTGNRNLDGIIGGYLRGSHVFIDVGEDVNYEDYTLLYGMTVKNFVTNGGSAVVVSPNEFTTSERSQEERENEIFFMQDKEIIGRDLEELWVESNGKVLEMMKEMKMPILMVNNYNVIERVLGTDAAKRWMNMTLDITPRRESFVIDVGKGTSLNDELASLACTHLKVKERDGCTILYGITPKTGIYVMEKKFSDESSDFDLIPIL